MVVRVCGGDNRSSRQVDVLIAAENLTVDESDNGRSLMRFPTSCRSAFRCPRNEHVLRAYGRPHWQTSSAQTVVPTDVDAGQSGRNTSDF